MKNNRMINKKTKDYLEELKEYGFIAYLTERVFRGLQWLPPQCFLNNRSDVQNKNLNALTKEEKKEQTKKRARKIDMCIILYIVIECITFYNASSEYAEYTWFRAICYIIAILRLIDIVQVNVNMILFDPLRIRRKHFMASLTRTVILLIINYFEIIICFAIMYLLNKNCFNNTSTWSDSLYFSIITQLTIGYGDIVPQGINKLIVCLQGILGLFFGLLILGRVISLLPNIDSDYEKHSN